jgi:hypothetical protein
MGVLTDIYLASPETAVNYDADPQSFREVTLTAKGITDLELSTLWAIYRNEPWDVNSLDAFEHLLSRDGGERMVIALPESLITCLAESDASTIASVSKKWAATEEMVRFAQYVPSYLNDLVELAKRAELDGKRLYLWVCV